MLYAPIVRLSERPRSSGSSSVSNPARRPIVSAAVVGAACAGPASASTIEAQGCPASSCEGRLSKARVTGIVWQIPKPVTRTRNPNLSHGRRAIMTTLSRGGDLSAVYASLQVPSTGFELQHLIHLIT